MNAKLLNTIVSVALLASLVLAHFARAERPLRTERQLEASATHIFSGTVQHTYSRTEDLKGFRYTYSVAEVSVAEARKGGDVVPNDRVFVRHWQKRWTRKRELTPTDDYGHEPIPEEGDAGEFFVKGNRTDGFELLPPNGFSKKASIEKVESGGRSSLLEKDPSTYMSLLYGPSHKRLKVLMAAEPQNSDDWKTIRSEALLLTELCSKLIASPRSTKDYWKNNSIAVRKSSTELQEAAEKKDFSKATRSYQSMIQSCNACHQGHVFLGSPPIVER